MSISEAVSCKNQGVSCIINPPRPKLRSVTGSAPRRNLIICSVFCRFPIKKKSLETIQFQGSSIFLMRYVNTMVQLLNLKTKSQSSGSDCDFERRKTFAVKVDALTRSPDIQRSFLSGPSVIIGFQKTQIYQWFAGSRQEVFILTYRLQHFYKYACCKLAVEFYSRMEYTMFERS